MIFLPDSFLPSNIPGTIVTVKVRNDSRHQWINFTVRHPDDSRYRVTQRRWCLRGSSRDIDLITMHGGLNPPPREDNGVDVVNDDGLTAFVPIIPQMTGDLGPPPRPSRGRPAPPLPNAGDQLPRSSRSTTPTGRPSTSTQEDARANDYHCHSGGHNYADVANKLCGLEAKLHNKERFSEKVRMCNMLKAHEEKEQTSSAPSTSHESAVPAYLLDREKQTHGKLLSNMIKQKRKEKAGKWEVPINKVKAVAESDAFKIVRTGKTRRKAWKRMVTKVTFVGDGFTRKPPKYERFIRPTGLRIKMASSKEETDGEKNVAPLSQPSDGEHWPLVEVTCCDEKTTDSSVGALQQVLGRSPDGSARLFQPATILFTGDATNQIVVPVNGRPGLAFIRPSDHVAFKDQYVPEVQYKTKLTNGNEVTRDGRPLPVEYLMVDVPVGAPLEPTYTLKGNAFAFTVENRQANGEKQMTFGAQDLVAFGKELSENRTYDSADLPRA